MALREGSLCGHRGRVEDVGKVGEPDGAHTHCYQILRNLVVVVLAHRSRHERGHSRRLEKQSLHRHGFAVSGWQPGARMVTIHDF